ncbi:mutS protein homolog 5-like [Amphibalanus amphitrite]|uniref:mutS protein homolog 5-like n=1 Tax=Amphibalanus amphitrite TaxID=1232801 RepID=UPI001C8FD8A7|nr:mutS protein homolog 5-like [Amphibalanus amphitrite]
MVLPTVDWSEPSGPGDDPFEGGPEDTDSSRQAPSVLSLAYGCGRLAAALYEPLSMTARLLRDTPDPPPHFVQLRALLGQLRPDQVITSGRQDERLLAVLSELLAADPRDDDQTPLQLQPAGDYRADSCRHRVLAVQLPAETSDDEQAHYNFITSRVDFAQTTMVRAFGGLLRYLDRRPLETLSRQPVMRIENLSLEDAMYVSSGAFRTLQVFAADRHPSSFKAETTREGLSVFAVLNKCCSPLGVAQLRRMLMQPLTSRRRIEARLDAVEFFTRPANEDVVTSLQTCLRRVRNLTPLLSRMRNARGLSGDWRTLYDTLHGGVVAAEVCRDLPAGVAVFDRAAGADCAAVQRLLHTLHQTVNLAETRELRRFTVHLGLDDTLDAHKRAYAALPELLSAEMAAEQAALPDQIQTCSMVFLPQVGFLVMVDEWREPLTREQQRDLPGLRFQFEDRGRVLYKSARCDALDESVGDVATAIRDRETQVMVRLSALVVAAAEEIHQLCSLCGELDALMALAKAANEFGYVRPRFVDENVLELQRSRHPLLELCADLVVPNDFSSGRQPHRDRLKLVTGANGAGKSVYLRQVALAVLMAQAGSFVAADAARLGVQRALFTVAPPALTGTGGDAAAGGGCGSAFLAELRQLCAAVAESGERALLAVDEFGGGTLAEDGAALLAAALSELLARRERCPHVLVSTHVHRLCSLLPPSQLVTPVCPELVAEPGGRAVTFLYQMATGSAGRSYAMAAATAACLPERLVHRAEQVMEAMVSGSDLCPDPELLRVEEAAVERARRAVETFLRADLDSEDPAELLRRVRQEYRGAEDPWEDSVAGGAAAPGSERPVPGSSVAGPAATPGGAAAAPGLRRDGAPRPGADSATGSSETPVSAPCQGGAATRPAGRGAPPSSSTATRGESSSRTGADSSSGPTAVPRAGAGRVPGARYRAVYSSDDQTRRSDRSGASEGPLGSRRPREQSSTWSEDPEAPLTRPGSGAEGWGTAAAGSAHTGPGGPGRSLTCSSDRPPPRPGPGGRVSDVSEDPLGWSRVGCVPRVAAGPSRYTEGLPVPSGVSQTPVIRAEPAGRGADRAAGGTDSGTSDLTTGRSDWSLATSKRASSPLLDSGPRPMGQQMEVTSGDTDTTPAERRGSYYYSRLRCETLVSASSGLGVSEGSARAAGVGRGSLRASDGSLRPSDGSAGSGRGDWWLAGRPLKRARTVDGERGEGPRPSVPADDPMSTGDT